MTDPRESARVEERRQAVLADTATTYAGYVSSGHARRWEGTAVGMAIAVADRDRWLGEVLRPALHGTIVDLGCGDGALGVLLDRATARPTRMIGVDILEHRLTEARTRAPWATFQAASADALPLRDGEADAVVAMTMLSSLADAWFRGRVLTEIDRVVAPGGRLVVYDIRYPSPRNPNVRPVSRSELASRFDGWSVESRSMTVLPPIARSPLAAGPRRYRALHTIPALRSHVGVVLVKPS